MYVNVKYSHLIWSLQNDFEIVLTQLKDTEGNSPTALLTKPPANRSVLLRQVPPPLLPLPHPVGPFDQIKKKKTSHTELQKSWFTQSKFLCTLENSRLNNLIYHLFI